MIRSLNHVALTVPDLEIGRAFYDTFGLETRVDNNDLVFRCHGRAQDQVRLIEGPKKRLSYVSFGTDSKNFETLKLKLEKHNVAIHDAPFAVSFGGFWFQDPDGDWVNVQITDAVESSVAAAPEINSPGRYRRVGRACDVSTQNKVARPRRMGHLIKFSPDVKRSVEFYGNVLGFRVSDRSRDILAFMHSPFGGDHHLIAFAKSTHPGLHHISFEVGDIDEIEIGAQKLIAAGYKDGFGLGRHVAGSNYFHYIRDPWNSLAEYFWDIDVIPENGDWVPIDAEPHELTAVWAQTPPPPEFVQNFEELR